MTCCVTMASKPITTSEDLPKISVLVVLNDGLVDFARPEACEYSRSRA